MILRVLMLMGVFENGMRKLVVGGQLGAEDYSPLGSYVCIVCLISASQET
jgi:hypothetical protein